jgi:hypothetical protein
MRVSGIAAGLAVQGSSCGEGCGIPVVAGAAVGAVVGSIVGLLVTTDRWKPVPMPAQPRRGGLGWQFPIMVTGRPGVALHLSY